MGAAAGPEATVGDRCPARQAGPSVAHPV